MEAVDVDWGRLEFEVSQVDFVLHSPIWRQSFRPEEAKGGSKLQLSGGKSGAKGGAGQKGFTAGTGDEEEKVGPLAWLQDFVQSRLQGELKD